MMPRQLGKYQLQQSLGRGATGEVWKAYDLQYRHEVAVKLIHTDLQADPHFLTYFTQEGQRLIELKHANIVPVREVSVARAPQGNETTAYLVMDYIEGQTLTEYLQKNAHRGFFPNIEQIVYLFTSLGVAVDYAHQQGFIHGNITPGNILLKASDTSKFSSGEPLLADVGLMQLLGSGGFVGAPQYMSPEQAKGEPANNRSDVYALGVILYECCTGIQPFRNGSSVAVMQQHINMLPTPPSLINPNIPAALSEVILRAMAKDTATRYAMASLLAAALADACSMQNNLHITLQTNSLETKQSYPGQNSLLGVPQPPEVARPQTSFQQRLSAPLKSINLSGSQRTVHPAQEPQKSSSPTPLPRPFEAAPADSAESGKYQSFSLVPVVPQPSMPERTQTPTQRTDQFALQSILAEISSPTPSKVLQAIQVQPGTETGTPPRPRKKNTPFYLLIAALLIVLLIAGGTIAGLAGFFKNQGSAGGQVFFQDDALGHNDLLRLELNNVPAPASGKSYFAWLEDSTNKILPLGLLTLSAGNASLLYAGDSQHTNLLPLVKDIFITQENSGSQPATPGQQKVFQAVFDTGTFPAIKRLLTPDSRFPNAASVVSGMFESIKSMNDKAGSIVDSLSNTGDLNLAQRQATRIIELLDGTNYARSSGDLPAQYPSQLPTKIGLLSNPQQPGYLDILSQQLDQVAAGNDQRIALHIQNTRYALNDLQDWLQKVRISSVQLLKAANLKDATSIGIALQLKQAAADAYTGHTIPPNASPLPIAGSAGAAQAYTECQYLATLDLHAV